MQSERVPPVRERGVGQPCEQVLVEVEVLEGGPGRAAHAADVVAAQVERAELAQARHQAEVERPEKVAAQVAGKGYGLVTTI